MPFSLLKELIAEGALGRREVFSETDLQGMHTYDDAFFFADEKMADDLHMEQVVPIIESRLFR